MNPILAPYASFAAKPAILPSKRTGVAGDIEKSSLYWSQFDVMTRSRSTYVLIKQSGDLELDRIPRRVWDFDKVALSQQIGRASELGERKGRTNIGTLKEFWMIADLPELHDQVHETRYDRSVCPNIGCLSKQIRD